MNKVQRAMKANPDLSRGFIRDALLATEQMNAGLATPYQARKKGKGGKGKPC